MYGSWYIVVLCASVITSFTTATSPTPQVLPKEHVHIMLSSFFSGTKRYSYYTTISTEWYTTTPTPEPLPTPSPSETEDNNGEGASNSTQPSSSNPEESRPLYTPITEPDVDSTLLTSDTSTFSQGATHCHNTLSLPLRKWIYTSHPATPSLAIAIGTPWLLTHPSTLKARLRARGFTVLDAPAPARPRGPCGWFAVAALGAAYAPSTLVHAKPGAARRVLGGPRDGVLRDVEGAVRGAWPAVEVAVVVVAAGWMVLWGPMAYGLWLVAARPFLRAVGEGLVGDVKAWRRRVLVRCGLWGAEDDYIEKAVCGAGGGSGQSGKGVCWAGRRNGGDEGGRGAGWRDGYGMLSSVAGSSIRQGAVSRESQRNDKGKKLKRNKTGKGKGKDSEDIEMTTVKGENASTENVEAFLDRNRNLFMRMQNIQAEEHEKMMAAVSARLREEKWSDNEDDEQTVNRNAACVQKPKPAHRKKDENSPLEIKPQPEPAQFEKTRYRDSPRNGQHEPGTPTKKRGIRIRSPPDDRPAQLDPVFDDAPKSKGGWWFRSLGVRKAKRLRLPQEFQMSPTYPEAVTNGQQTPRLEIEYIPEPAPTHAAEPLASSPTARDVTDSEPENNQHPPTRLLSNEGDILDLMGMGVGGFWSDDRGSAMFRL